MARGTKNSSASTVITNIRRRSPSSRLQDNDEAAALPSPLARSKLPLASLAFIAVIAALPAAGRDEHREGFGGKPYDVRAQWHLTAEQDRKHCLPVPRSVDAVEWAHARVEYSAPAARLRPRWQRFPLC